MKDVAVEVVEDGVPIRRNDASSNNFKACKKQHIVVAFDTTQSLLGRITEREVLIDN